ncbi:MAG: hypothetical protein M3R03_09175 [Pseudomonadota bacterium]|nr:hypothetical protein [Pseudomonadota bacterium]
MALFIVFLNALLGTAILGVVARSLIDLFSVTLPARFGGFCIALGFALGRYSFVGPIDGHLWISASAALGAVVALIGLWYWLVAKSPALQAEKQN